MRTRALFWNLSKERKVWYREYGNKSEFSETEKVVLDGFRAQPEHPAIKFEFLPEEVQLLIVQKDRDLADQRKALLRFSTVVWIGFIGLLASSLLMQDLLEEKMMVVFGASAALSVISYFFLVRGFTETEVSVHNENIIRAWEENYVQERRLSAPRNS